MAHLSKDALNIMMQLGTDEVAEYEELDDDRLFVKHVAQGESELLFLDSLLLETFGGKEKESDVHA